MMTSGLLNIENILSQDYAREEMSGHADKGLNTARHLNQTWA